MAYSHEATANKYKRLTIVNRTIHTLEIKKQVKEDKITKIQDEINEINKMLENLYKQTMENRE